MPTSTLCLPVLVHLESFKPYKKFMPGFDKKCLFTTLVWNSLNDFCMLAMIGCAISYVFIFI